MTTTTDLRAPRVAVVVPTLDEERTLASCLDAIGGQPEVEVVVSDGGSRDRTLAVAAARGVTVVVGPPGRGGQLARGAAATVAPILLFVHADCLLPSGWRSAVEATLAEEGVALACFRLHTVPTGEATRGRRLWLRLADLRSFGPLLPYGDQGFAVTRDTYQTVGGFQAIPVMEDLAFARACRGRGRTARIPLAMRTSARRVERHPFRTRLATATFPWLFRAGVSPERLARWYGVVR